MNSFSMGLSLLAAGGTAPKEIESSVLVWRLFLVILLCLAPYLVAAVLSRALQLREYSNRIGTVLLAFTLGLAPFGYRIAQTGDLGSWRDAVRWGIDLAGGTNLLYEVETEKAIEEGKPIPQAMDQMVATIGKRINPSGTEEVVVRKVGQTRIEIIIPGADQGVVAQKKEQMTRLGSLEFGIVANRADHGSTIIAAKNLPEDQDKLVEDGQIVAVWRGLSEKNDMPSSEATRRVPRKDEKGEDVLVSQVLIIKELEDDEVSGEYLRRAAIGVSESGSPCVNFDFDSEGAIRFFRLTDRNKPRADGTKRQLAIILDGKVHSAPNLNSAISRSGQITGNFTGEELQKLVEVLNAGALQLPIKREPISEFSISPLLGADVRDKGLLAIYISSSAVFIFMLWYYRFAGVVANLSLLLNLVLIIGSMAICNATFTLPGLAGMVLTIGMAVDSNVLIYERMREEMERGSSIRMVIHNGFDKALSAIVDSNVTTLIAAVVLYMIGTDAIRGFAVSLFIGLTMSMFSVLYFGRLMFDIAERKRLIRDKMTMLKLINISNVDFIGKLKLALTCSITFIVLGVVLVLARGKESLDIDFSGGTSVTFQFVKDQQIDDVRSKLQKSFDSMSLERLALPKEDALGERGIQFRLRSKEEDSKKICDSITATFKDASYELKKVTLTYSPLTKRETTSLLQPRREDAVLGSAGQDEVKPESVDKKEAKADNVNKSDAAETPKKDSTSVENADAAKSPAKSDAKPTEGEKEKPSETSEKEPVTPATTKPAANQEKATRVDSYAGANRTELTFSSEISESTASEYLLKELNRVNKAYSEANVLFKVKGTSGSGLKALEGQAKKFDKMEVEVRSTVSDAELNQALQAMQKVMAETPIFEEVSNFAASVAEGMRYYAILALLASGVGTVIYLWFRFTKPDYGIAAVVAVFHDVLFTLACLPMAYYLSLTPLGPILGLEDFKLNLSLVAAFMTIIGYSLNDTIVIFDRIREIRGRNPMLTAKMVNDSVNQTFSRTILTAVTVFITVAILYALGGEGIHGFAFCMLVGTLVGCYSTIYIASPILLWLWDREQQRKAANRIS